MNRHWWPRRKPPRELKVTVDGYDLRDLIRTEISAFADMLADQADEPQMAYGGTEQEAREAADALAERNESATALGEEFARIVTDSVIQRHAKHVIDIARDPLGD